LETPSYKEEADSKACCLLFVSNFSKIGGWMSSVITMSVFESQHVQTDWG